MATPVNCVCGTALALEPGTSAVCPVCAAILSAPPVEQFDLAQEDEILEVTEVIEEFELAEEESFEKPDEEEDVPEVEVEECAAAWKKKAGAPEVSDRPEFVRRAEAIGNRFGTIGSIDLDQLAACVACGAAGAWGLAGQDDRVQMFYLVAGKTLKRFRKHDADVLSAAVSPDGVLAATGDREGTVLCWDLLTHKVKRAYDEHHGAVIAVAFSPQGNFVVSGDVDGVTKLWKWASGRECELADADWSEEVTAVAFSPDGTRLAAGGNRGRIHVWSTQTGRCGLKFRNLRLPISSVQFSADGSVLTATCRPPQVACFPEVWRWKAATGEPLECPLPTEIPVLIPYFGTLDNGGQRLLLAGRRPPAAAYLPVLSRLEVWDLRTGRRVHAFEEFEGEIDCLAVSPENARIVATLDNHRLQVWAMPIRQESNRPPERTEERRRNR